MSTKTSRKHCNTCNTTTGWTVKSINWPLHIILVIFTAGFWLIPLLFIAVFSKSGGVCNACGSEG